MTTHIKGMDLCRGFFFDHAKAIIDSTCPNLPYTAGLLGYGSDVLGYDDAVSRDHMWGPRFYLFLRQEDMAKKSVLWEALTTRLPYTYRGYSVHFTEPDEADNGVRHPLPITEGKVNPLIFILSFEEYLTEQLGSADLAHITPAMWLSFSEHRLLSLVSAQFYVDGLACEKRLAYIRFYPDTIKRYLAASCWDIIAAEQAFMKRAADCGDEIGSRLVCARIAERLMRLCFLYRETYAPYSKWFGTAFGKLDIAPVVGESIREALVTNDSETRETMLIRAQLAVAAIHNQSGMTPPVDVREELYYGRPVRVIFADKLADAISDTLTGTALDGIPRIGSFSQLGGLSGLSDEVEYQDSVTGLYLHLQKNEKIYTNQKEEQVCP